MNRAERRKHGLQQKPKTYTLTEAQITQIKNDAVEEALSVLLAIPVMVLRDKFGFGQLRIDRFTHYFFGWLESVHKGEVTLAELTKTLKDEGGITIVPPKK